jgi:rhamnosyltransferase
MSGDRCVLPRVLILMASYNGERFIADQIATILNQKDVAVTLFIRDDGSSDSTPAIIALEAKRDRRIRVIDRKGSATGSAALNFLKMLETVEFDDADFIALADQDDLWLTHKLKRAVDRIGSCGASGYSANLVAFDNEGRRNPWLLRKHDTQRRFDYLFQGASAGCTYVLNRTTADAIRKWLAALTYHPNFGISHDWLIYAFVRHNRLAWVFDDVAPILYRQHSANVYGAQPGLGNAVERIKLLRSKWYRQHVLWLASQLDLSPEERQLVERVTRLSIVDRLSLFASARELRRRPRDVFMLQLALATGIF